jgi:hypothetical protein
VIRTVRALYFIALGLWVGGMATLAFVVAPTLFRVTRGTAGQAFGSILRSFGPFQIAFGVVAAVTLAVLIKIGDLKTRTGLIRLGVLAVMLILVCTSQFYLSPAIERERLSIANFDSMPPGVPAKARFDSLHRTSVWLASATLILGVGLLGLSAAGVKSADGA